MIIHLRDNMFNDTRHSDNMRYGCAVTLH